jgi:guanine deaminase
MTEHTAFMARAIEIARTEMLNNGAAPFGAVIVKDGRIVGEGVNRVVTHHDPTSHGEVEAIRDAGRNLGTWDLSGCDLYTTCEPCEMCVAAMYWARVDRMFYAATLADCASIGLDTSPLTVLVRNDLPNRALPATQIMHGEARDVLELWSRQPGFSVF